MSVILHIANGRASFAYAPNDDIALSVKSFDAGEQSYLYENHVTREMRALFVIGKHPEGNDIWKKLVDPTAPLTARTIRDLIGDSSIKVVTVDDNAINMFTSDTHVGTKLINGVTYNFGDVDTTREEYYNGNLDEYVFDWFLVRSQLPDE